MTSGGNHDARVQRQFGASAEHYRTSDSHARGRSLERLVELVRPERGWVVLDAATGAGHTAAALARHSGMVVAGDMTREMLQQARIVCAENGLANVTLVQERAGALSYRDGVFDLVTCRVAAHHFPDPAVFVGECVRVLKPTGILAVVDNVVPPDADDAAWINEFERQRDPSHARCLDLAQWRELYTRNGLAMEHEESSPKWFDFQAWMRRMNVPEDTVDRLGRELLDAPAGVRRYWRPEREDGRIRLALQEAILIGRRRL